MAKASFTVEAVAMMPEISASIITPNSRGGIGSCFFIEFLVGC
jgi:hypothetical protein